MLRSIIKFLLLLLLCIVCVLFKILNGIMCIAGLVSKQKEEIFFCALREINWTLFFYQVCSRSLNNIHYTKTNLHPLFCTSSWISGNSAGGIWRHTERKLRLVLLRKLTSLRHFRTEFPGLALLTNPFFCVEISWSRTEYLTTVSSNLCILKIF